MTGSPSRRPAARRGGGDRPPGDQAALSPRYALGVIPNSRLNACERAYGLPYPVSRATVASGASVSRSRVAARVSRHQVR
ncbi:hypothetical protein SHL15_4529 [Streptomyces hygroscopicus subsp. limoneus]|nr:hypothetical protein SHL15_4529 [Streptomyces hygroscopicus subsp. limoneus]